MNLIVYGENPTYGFFSGTHGDEWGVIEPLKEVIDTYKMRVGSFIFIPECSPTAVKNKTRNNAEGHDVNRSFIKHPTDREVLEIISDLKPYTLDTCFDFHEDNEVAGVYVYDSYNVEGSRTLTSFRDKIRSVDIPLFSGIDDVNDNSLGRRVHEGYRVSLPPEQNTDGEYIYEGFFDYWALIEGIAKRWLTLETPTQFTQLQKKKVIDIFFQTFVLENI